MPLNKTVQEIDNSDEFERYQTEYPNEESAVTLNDKQLIDIEVPKLGTLLFYGKTMSGKTVVMKSLLHKYAAQHNQIFVFCGSASEDWNDCIDKRCVFRIDETLENKLRIIIKAAEKLKEKKKHTLIILDDPFNGKAKYHHSKIWDELSSMSRHCLISIWMAVQNPGHIPPILKSNVVGYFITKVPRQALAQIFEYSYGFESKREFIDYVDSNSSKGMVFYNDCFDAYAEDSYYMADVPFPCPKFKIKMV